MPTTNIRGRQILDGDVARVDLNTGTSSSAVIRKLLPASDASITLTSTGVDAGTGDVTLVTAKASATQLGMIKVGTGLSVDVNGVLSATAGGIGGSGTANRLAKFSGATTLTNSVIIDDGSNITIGNTSTFTYKFNVQGFSGKYISFWTPTIQGVNNNGLLSHDGGGFPSQAPMGYNATMHVFNGEVTGGGTVQVAGDVNISGTFRVNGNAIGTGGGGISGGGTTGVIPKWSGGTSLTNSIMSDDGSTFVTINNPSTGASTSGVIFSLQGSNRGTLQYSSSILSLSTYNADNIRINPNGNVHTFDSSGRVILLGSSNPIYTNILFSVLLGTNVSTYTDITALSGGNFRVFSYFGSSNTGVLFGTGLTNTADFNIGSYSNITANSNLCFYGYKFNTGYYNTLTVKWNTVNMPTLPSSISGLSPGDLYKDANGFVKVA